MGELDGFDRLWIRELTSRKSTRLVTADKVGEIRRTRSASARITEVYQRANARPKNALAGLLKASIRQCRPGLGGISRCVAGDNDRRQAAEGDRAPGWRMIGSPACTGGRTRSIVGDLHQFYLVVDDLEHIADQEPLSRDLPS